MGEIPASAKKALIVTARAPLDFGETDELNYGLRIGNIYNR